MTRVAEIVVEVPLGGRAAAERVAWAAGAQGLETRDGDHGVGRGRVQIVWWTPGALGTALARKVRAELGPAASVRTRLVDAAWLPPPRPRALGKGFVVVGADDARSHVRGRRALAIEASLGFGDGVHATTRLCVEALERLAPLPARVLDVGTGTGVLSIVASLLGAKAIAATDIDPLALHAARENLRRNAVRARLTATLPKGPFGLVVANLYFEPLLALLPELCARADVLVVSGFGVGSTPRVVEALRGQGLRPARPRTREGFACLTAARPPSR